MLESKAALMSKTEIIEKDGSKYYYTISSHNIVNPLGVIKATLKEYSLYRIGSTEIAVGKLYKTDEGNWYDLPTNDSINSLLATSLKMAIDESENQKAIEES